MRRILFIPALMLAVSSGCYYDVEAELYPDTCAVPDVVSWTTDIQPVINASCATSGCHVTGGTGPGNMESYEGVKAKVDDGEFQIRVLQEQNMPPSESLSNCTLQIIQAWVDAGAPQN